MKYPPSSKLCPVKITGPSFLCSALPQFISIRRLLLAAFIFSVVFDSCVPVSYYYKQTYINSGRNYYSAGKMDSAILAYTNAIKNEPRNTDGYSERAVVYSALKRFPEAMSDIDKAISLSERKWPLYNTRATIYENQGMHIQAIDDYTKYITKADKNIPDYYLGYWGRAKAYQKLEQYTEAITDFNQSIKLKPTDINLFSWRGNCYFSIGRYLDAANDFEIYTQANPLYFDYVYQLGFCYTKLNSKEKSLTIFRKLSELNQSIPIYFPEKNLADFYDIPLRRKIVKESVEEAMLNLEEAKTISSKSLLEIKLTTVFEKLMQAWGFGSTYPTTQDDNIVLGKVIKNMYTVYPQFKTKPAIPEIVRKLTVQATSATEDKNYNKAISLYTKALNITPYYPTGHFNLALLYATTSNYKNAISEMNKYIVLAPDATDARSAQDKIYEWEMKIK